MSNFGGEDWSKQISTVKDGLAAFIDQWLSQMASENKKILGIFLQTSDPATGKLHDCLIVDFTQHSLS